MKHNPINLPQTRCKYSHQKINLNSLSDIFLLIFLYSGNCLYLSKVSIQSLLSSGGIAPEISFQSTIERPEFVSLVIPPIVIIISISKIPRFSHRSI